MSISLDRPKAGGTAEDRVSRLTRMFPVLLYVAILTLAFIAVRVTARHLDEQRAHLLDSHRDTMAWSAFVVEAPLVSQLEAVAFEAKRTLPAFVKTADFAAGDAEAEQALRKKLDTWAAGRIRAHSFLIESITLLDTSGRVMGGAPMEITPETKALHQKSLTVGDKMKFLNAIFSPAPDSPEGEPCVRLWNPIYLVSNLESQGVIVYTIKLKGLGTQERVPSPKRAAMRMLPQIIRQAESRGIAAQDKESRTLILGTDFRVIQTRSGERFERRIPDPGERFATAEIRRAYETGVRENRKQITFHMPAEGDTPACYCFFDLSTRELGYVILVQTVESTILAPWRDAQRSAIGAGGLLVVVFTLTVLFDLRRRRNRAQLAALTTRFGVQLAREEEMRKAQEGLEARVAERTAELAEANRELNAYAHTVSHDLRAPLRAVRNYVSLLKFEHPELSRGEPGEYMARIVANLNHMTGLIEDILRLSKISRATPVRQSCDLAAMVREIAARLRETWPANAVTLVAPECCEVEADPALIRIALENLLGNAWKYSSKTPDPRVEFGVRDAGAGRREYFVRDNGAGFESEYAAKLFAPFVRLHATHEFEGSGLGLATAARIIRLHGGDIRAEGAKGAGACFSFTLGNA